MVSNPLIRKILFLAANPKDTPPLRLDEEIREISEGLRRARHRDQFILEQRWAVRPKDIRRAMLDIEPQIVHFSGHGEGNKRDQEEDYSSATTLDIFVNSKTGPTVEGLFFEDETGNSQLVDGAALTNLFELFANQIECVVLASCYSITQAKAIVQHIPYVIGMRKAVGDKTAIEFTTGFYDAMAAGRSIEEAYKFGCNALQLEVVSEHLTPILMKSAAAKRATSLVPTAKSPSALHPSIPENQAIEVFFSYAHEDEKLRDELAKHLKLLERQKVIKAWYDRDITAGEEWRHTVEQQLNTAQVILLLVSADFLASDFCWSVELQRAMEQHEAGEARVIPIILREVDWYSAPFGKLQALPKNAEPVVNWANLDQAFTDIAIGIRNVVESLRK